MKKQRFVVVTTDSSRRGVFGGELISYDQDKQYVVLKNAKMCIFWNEETKGVLGLANPGPQKGCRLSPAVEKIEINGVTSVIDMSSEAIKQWDKQLWN